MSYQDKVRNRTRTSRSSYNFGGFVEWFQNKLTDNRPSISFRAVILTCLTLMMGGALACQVIWQHVRHTRTKVQINSLEQRHHELTMKIQKKELKVSRLERLDRIQRIAVNQLGMEPLNETPVMEMSQTQWVQSSREGDEPMIP